MRHYSFKSPTTVSAGVGKLASPAAPPDAKNKLVANLKNAIVTTRSQAMLKSGMSNMTTRADKNVVTPSTGITPASGGIYSEMFSDLIPSVNFNKITLTGGTKNAPLNVRVNIVLKDIVEDDSISSWFTNSLENDETSSPFERYLKLNIIQCTHEDVCEVLSGRQPNSYLIEKGISKKQALEHILNKSVNLDSKINTGADDSKSINEYRRITPSGEEIIEVPVEESFRVFTKDLGGEPLHLSYFVWISMDVAKMANDFNMDEEFFKMAAPATSVYSEYVIQNGNVATDTNIFLLPSGEVWEGEVHYHDPAINPDPVNKSFKGYMTGKVHTPNSQYLQVKTVSNSKIRDYRYVHRVEERYRSVTQARIGAGLVEGEAEVGEAIEEDVISQSVTQYTKLLGKEVKPDKNSAIFTDLWSSLDEAHNGNGMFALDYVSFLKSNCAYPYLWSISEETNLKLLSIAKILKIQLRRRQVDPSSKTNNKLGTPDRPNAKKQTYRVLATSGDPRRRKVIKTVDDSRCYFQETKVDLHGSPTSRTDGIRWFTFTDRGLLQEKNGTYQYSLFLKSIDPTVVLFKKNLHRLMRARYRLNRYLSEALSYTNNKPHFDIYIDRFIPEFIRDMNTERGRELWKESSEDYLRALREVSSVLQQPAYPGSSLTLETVLPATLSSYLDPSKGSPEGIQTVINMVDSFIKELQNKTGNLSLGATRQARKNTNSVPSPRVRSSRNIRVLETEHVFGSGQEIVLDGQRGKGYDYITNQTLDFQRDSIKGKGTRTITSRYYKKRCEIETKRYFTISSQNSGANKDFDLQGILGKLEPDLSLSSENPKDSLINQKFSFLTPAFVFQSFGRGVGGLRGEGSTPPPSGDYVGWQLDLPIGNASAPTPPLSQQVIQAAPVINQSVSNLQPPMPVPKNEQQEPPSNLDEVQANVIAAQANADFSLFPISVKGYSPPNKSKLSPAQQSMKKQYMDLLASRVQVVDAVSEFYLDKPFNSRTNSKTFEVDDSNPSDESINEPQGPDYENIDHAEDVGSEKLLPLQKIQPIIPKQILNINPTAVLQALGNMSFGYFPGGPRGPISYNSFHISNFQQLNFSDPKTPSLLDGENPSNKISILKSLPNQLKSLALATSDLVLLNPFKVPSVISESENAPLLEETPWFFKPENMSKIWQMFQNIVEIEYLYSFKTPIMQRRDQSGLVKVNGERDLLKSPTWLKLDRDVINRLEEGERKVSLLCRIKKYKNKKLGIGYAAKKDLPVIDQYFNLVIDPFADPDLGRLDAADDGDLQGELTTILASTVGAPSGNSNLVSGDSSNVENFLTINKFTTRVDPTTGEQVTVQEFDGNLVISNNCNDNGGTP